jgi:hypothetical protein
MADFSAADSHHRFLIEANCVFFLVIVVIATSPIIDRERATGLHGAASSKPLQWRCTLRTWTNTQQAYASCP